MKGQFAILRKAARLAVSFAQSRYAMLKPSNRVSVFTSTYAHLDEASVQLTTGSSETRVGI